MPVTLLHNYFWCVTLQVHCAGITLAVITWLHRYLFYWKLLHIWITWNKVTCTTWDKILIIKYIYNLSSICPYTLNYSVIVDCRFQFQAFGCLLTNEFLFWCMTFWRPCLLTLSLDHPTVSMYVTYPCSILLFYL